MQVNRKNKLIQSLKLLLYFVNSIINVKRAILAFPRHAKYFIDLATYKRLENSEHLEFLDLDPRIHEATDDAGVGKESLYQNVWAFQLIIKNKADTHVDVGSNTLFLGMLSVIKKVIFIDLRPFDCNLNNLEFRQGSILNLPFENDSIESMSCLHTIEHIGLGRYGDPLDPDGSKKAIKELQKKVAQGGNLYISVPVGRHHTAFNCHRVFSPQHIIDAFDEMQLVELSGIGSDNLLHRNIEIDKLSNLEYSLGLFWFKKDG